MLRVGLSGGIGSGKSTVAGRLAEHGAMLIDADRIAREVVEPGTDGLAEVVEAFGADLLDPDGALDRPALAARVFGDDVARARLNAIVHPRVGARTQELTEQAADDAIVVYDVPLLVENGLAPFYHLVIIVDASVEQRIHRLVRQRGMPEQDARARLATQADEAARRAVADVWLDNGGTPDQVLAAADALWADRLVPFEANVRLHRCSPRGGPHLADPNPDWPVRARRLIDRLRVAAGSRALAIAHIGSTAVPGLPAEDVLDLQIAVADLAEADALASPLDKAGFPLVPGLEQDIGGPDGPGRRVHASADPARWANVHLRVADSPGWRSALAFRDWLRADESARTDYLAMKRRVADGHQHGDIPEYARAKESWFEESTERMWDWVARSGWTPPAE